MNQQIIAMAACLILIVPAGAGHAAEQRSPMWGGSGGTRSYNLDCGGAGIMVGVTARWGSWLDQIGVLCRSVNSAGVLGNYYTRGPVGGQGGGTSGSAKCREGYVVVVAFGESGMFVDSFRASCKRWDAATRRPVGDAVQDVVIGQAKALANYNRFDCSGTAVGKALRGRYGTYIDSLQFVCDQYNL